ncbi:MAG: YfgM family protein [bacterium]
MSEYLEEEEQMARLRSWWSEYGVTVIVAVVLSVAAIIGWRWYDSHKQTQAHEGANAYAAYQAAQGSAKESAGDTIAQNFSGSAYHIFVLFDRAQTAVEEGDLLAAEAFLNTAVEEADAPLLRDLAKIRLAKVQRGLDQSDAALATLDAIGNAGYRSWALEAKGDIFVSRNELEKAYEAYSAAKDALAPGEQRPILDMKWKNVTPFNGQYVEFTDTLEAALQDAQSTLAAQESDESQPNNAEAEQDQPVEPAASDENN